MDKSLITAFENLLGKLNTADERKEACTGPCHGLSANAAWSAPCANCPHLKEFAIHG